MVFKNRNCDDMGLDRVAIKLSDPSSASEYQCYSIVPTKSQPEIYNGISYV